MARQKRKYKNKQESSENQLTNIISKRSFNQWKYSAKKRGIEWNLTIEYLQRLFITQNETCPITHQKLTFVKDTTRFGKFQNASLDRIDNSLGYVESNVRFTTKWYNMLKHVLTDDQLIEYCRNIIVVYDYEKLVKEKDKCNV